MPSFLFRNKDVPEDKDINHDNWQNYLLEHFDREGLEILEVGSRVVTGSHFGQSFKHAHYTGIETHYSFSSHERPWHFFQYSENALNVLFPEKFGIECEKKGCSNLIKGCYSWRSSGYLRGVPVRGLYCHSEFLGRKVREVENLSWDNVSNDDAANGTKYPAPRK